jgi:hypothetical protein
MDNKQEGVQSVLPNSPVSEQSNINYDFNFTNQTTAPTENSLSTERPNSVMPQKVEPVDIDTAAGSSNSVEQSGIQTPASPIQSNIRTSGTTTEEELVIDASKAKVEILDEYAISMDAAAEKVRNKKNNIFVGVIFGIIILFVVLLRVIISIVGY